MKNFTSTKRAAWQLMKDDWIRIGGTLYRVVDTHPAYMSNDQIGITLRPSTGDPITRINLLCLRGTTFKIYNQK